MRAILISMLFIVSPLVRAYEWKDLRREFKQVTGAMPECRLEDDRPKYPYVIAKKDLPARKRYEMKRCQEIMQCFLERKSDLRSLNVTNIYFRDGDESHTPGFIILDNQKLEVSLHVAHDLCQQNKYKAFMENLSKQKELGEQRLKAFAEIGHELKVDVLVDERVLFEKENMADVVIKNLKDYIQYHAVDFQETDIEKLYISYYRDKSELSLDGLLGIGLYSTAVYREKLFSELDKYRFFHVTESY